MPISRSQRKKRPGTRPQLSRQALLPLASPIVDSLALQHHLMLELVGSGRATSQEVSNMAQIVILTQLLEEEGGHLVPELFIEAHDVLSACHAQLVATGRCVPDRAAFETLARIVTLHDAQLATCPVHRLERVTERLKSMLTNHARGAV